MLRWNRGSRPAKSMPYALQTELASELQNEIDRLGTLLNRDLTHWLQPREEAAQEPRARRIRRFRGRSGGMMLALGGREARKHHDEEGK